MHQPENTYGYTDLTGAAKYNREMLFLIYYNYFNACLSYGQYHWHMILTLVALTLSEERMWISGKR